MKFPRLAKQLARTTNRPYNTVLREFKRGWCSWPRRAITGKTRNIAYKSWECMIQRCTNSNFTDYKNYGGRGIEVCDRWRISFDWFIKDVGERPGLNYSIDRIDPEGNYEPGNVKWSTPTEQSNNKRKPNGSIVRLGEAKWGVWRRDKYVGKATTELLARELLENYLIKEGEGFHNANN